MMRFEFEKLYGCTALRRVMDCRAKPGNDG
jgi:hypothetical protein